MPLCISKLEWSLCLFFNNGMMILTQKSLGTMLCCSNALKRRHKWTNRPVQPYIICSLYMPSKLTAFSSLSLDVHSYKSCNSTNIDSVLENANYGTMFY